MFLSYSHHMPPVLQTHKLAHSFTISRIYQVIWPCGANIYILICWILNPPGGLFCSRQNKKNSHRFPLTGLACEVGLMRGERGAPGFCPSDSRAAAIEINPQLKPQDPCAIIKHCTCSQTQNFKLHSFRARGRLSFLKFIILL